VHNCELRLFQRPDDAVIRGYDRRTERDFSRPGHFFSNYESLTRADARAIVEDTLGLTPFPSRCAAPFGSSSPPTIRPTWSPRLIRAW